MPTLDRLAAPIDRGQRGGDTCAAELNDNSRSRRLIEVRLRLAAYPDLNTDARSGWAFCLCRSLGKSCRWAPRADLAIAHDHLIDEQSNALRQTRRRTREHPSEVKA